MDVGRRILRIDWVSLAAGHYGTPSILSGTHWILGRPVETTARYGTRALQLLLPQAKAEGLAYVELTTQTDNIASQRVIEANGGEVVELFHKSHAHGGAESFRYRILLR